MSELIAYLDSLVARIASGNETAQYEVKLKRPTPLGIKLKLNSRVLALQEDRAEVVIELKVDGKTCATGRGLFVAVKESHPAYHRWH